MEEVIKLLVFNFVDLFKICRSIIWENIKSKSEYNSNNYFFIIQKNKNGEFFDYLIAKT